MDENGRPPAADPDVPPEARAPFDAPLPPAQPSPQAQPYPPAPQPYATTSPTPPYTAQPHAPQQPSPAQQYPAQPYPAPPYPAQQYPTQQYPAPPYAPQQPYPSQQYPSQQYPPQQYPPQQYPSQQYPPQQYPAQPYPSQYAQPWPVPPRPPSPAARRRTRALTVVLSCLGAVLVVASGLAMTSAFWQGWQEGMAEVQGSGSSGPSGTGAGGGQTQSLTPLYEDLNVALAAQDREAFFARVDGDAVAALSQWWDNMDELGWTTGAIAPWGVGNMTATGDRDTVQVSLGADLAYAQRVVGTAAGEDGSLYTFGSAYLVDVDTSGPEPVVTGFRPAGDPMPWDGVALAAVDAGHVVVAGLPTELAHLEEVAVGASVAAEWVLEDHAALRGAPADAPADAGFVVFATEDSELFLSWFGENREGSWTWDPAGFAMSGYLPSPGTAGLDAELATGDFAVGGITAVGPEDGETPEDLEVILVHEFAHVLQYVDMPSSGLTIPLSSTEGWATWVELRYLNGGEYPLDGWFADYLGGCLGQDEVLLPTDEDFWAEDADCAYVLSSTLYAYAEIEGGDPIAVADEASEDGVSPLAAAGAAGTPFTRQEWSAWVDDTFR